MSRKILRFQVIDESKKRKINFTKPSPGDPSYNIYYKTSNNFSLIKLSFMVSYLQKYISFQNNKFLTNYLIEKMFQQNIMFGLFY